MKKIIKKIIIIFILITLNIILNLLYNGKVFAISQTTTTDINSINSSQYPQIKEVLQKLKSEHPNWKFKILYTDIEWKDAIANEYVGHGGSPRNLVTAKNDSKYGGEWICQVCGKNKLYDNESWRCASEKAIAYMMDPRNSTNYTDIFQFMELSYTECNINTINKMVQNTFLNNTSYINTIIEAGKKYNVNAYYLIARMLQEQGNSGSVLSSGKGYNGQYVGYYNVFNIGASGNGKETVILNGLKKAKSKGWTTLEKSIIGGTEIIAESYIAKGQNTLYFQKFDVEYSDKELYWHQYMQNILAAQSEGATLRKTFESVGAADRDYTFIIPLYKNMPTSASGRPSTSSSNIPTTTELVRVNVNSSLILRDAANKSAKKVGNIYKDEIVTRLEKATSKVDGTYWDYIMKADGTKGYAARQTYDHETTYKLYLVPVENEKPTQPEGSNNKVEIDNGNTIIRAVPDAEIKDLSSIIKGNIVVKNQRGEVIANNNKLSTGCVVNDTYFVSVLGDINGDGKVDTADLLAIQKHLLKIATIQGSASTSAADINNDSKIDTADLLAIQKKLLNISNIQL